ncbi:OmpA/MotB family protein [Gracilimonas halophila]|uniref:Flagellar motor protein MotB n=1 Tax=Gracilimonas halophila TaxID=1834464 RepID=A0ABW5JIR7_9BACT
MFDHKNISIEEEENPFWITYADILSSLLIIILLVMVFVIYELMSTKRVVTESLAEVAKAEMVRKDILQDIEDRLEQENIEVTIADNFSVLRIPESTLTFKSNQYEIPVSANVRDQLRRIGEVLFEEINEDSSSKYFDTIFIEGHTDIRPTEREMGNWGLSTFRAISVWNYWNDFSNDSLALLVNSKNDKLFSVSGYGETRPSTNQQLSLEDYRKNRRIDVRFTIRRPTSLDLQDIMTNFE